MPGRAIFGVGAIRTAARKRAKATSLRATADEIGMSYTAFRHFLDGGKPHPRTREKLVAWYARRDGRGPSEVAAEDVEAAIQLLAHFVAVASTEDTRRRRIHDIRRRALGDDSD